MIYGYLYQGSGAGNQLHRYIATRAKALGLKTDWRMLYIPDGSGKPEGFKCESFIDFDKSKIVYEIPTILKHFEEKKVVENGVDIRGYDPEFNFIEDDTIIDGEFQDERYWNQYENEVREWLKVEPMESDDNLCVINFRGGEFYVYPDLGLTKDYYDQAIQMMIEKNPKMYFEVHTDDPELARQFFPEVINNQMCDIFRNIGMNWVTLRYAKYAILSNSSFAIFPRWLRHGEAIATSKIVPTYDEAVTIAPRYWARRNTKVWALPSNYYSRFQYI